MKFTVKVHGWYESNTMPDLEETVTVECYGKRGGTNANVLRRRAIDKAIKEVEERWYSRGIPIELVDVGATIESRPRKSRGLEHVARDRRIRRKAMKINQNNTSPRYWNKVLSDLNLYADRGKHLPKKPRGKRRRKNQKGLAVRTAFGSNKTAPEGFNHSGAKVETCSPHHTHPLPHLQR